MQILPRHHSGRRSATKIWSASKLAKLHLNSSGVAPDSFPRSTTEQPTAKKRHVLIQKGGLQFSKACSTSTIGWSWPNANSASQTQRHNGLCCCVHKRGSRSKSLNFEVDQCARHERTPAQVGLALPGKHSGTEHRSRQSNSADAQPEKEGC